MRILIVSATATECCFDVRPEIKVGVPVKVIEPFNHDIDVLITGIGAVPTAFNLAMCVQQYDLVINIGIAGSYQSNISIGTVVCVKEDAFGDYGIDDRGTFRTFSEMRPSTNNFHPKEEILVNPWINLEFPKFNLPLVKGLTLSTASGSKEVIAKIIQRWNADIETMEGAAVFYVCRMLGIRFISYRAISNLVEPRDKSKWDIDKALNNLNIEVRNFINTL